MSKTATAGAAIAVPNITISEIAKGDIFSESSHYVAEKVNSKTVTFKHLGTGEMVDLSYKYVQDLLQTADQFLTEKTVNKEDSAKSGLGIRSIFENIGTSQVFQVCFQKQDTPKSAKQIKEEKTKIIEMSTKQLATKGRLATANIQALISNILDNPVTDTIPGEERILRGYKVQFTSRDGRYDCVDMDITSGNNIRPVNINTIKWLVVGGVRYNVK